MPPDYIFNGERHMLCALPRKIKDTWDEAWLTAQLVSNLYFVADWYQVLMRKYYYEMPLYSGILVTTSIPSAYFDLKLVHPGDIDIIAIPYEQDRLLLSKTLVIEIKVIRASYAKQHKSPNQYGFTQAQALSDYGFPYTAVGHIIVSNPGPEETYETLEAFLIHEGDRLTYVGPQASDPLPRALLERAYGRLCANRKNNQLGFFAKYMQAEQQWLSYGAPAENAGYTEKCMLAIQKCYREHRELFFRIPRYSPEEIEKRLMNTQRDKSEV